MTSRRVHVTSFCVRGDGTSTAAHGHKRTVVTLFLVRTEMFEPLRRGLAPALDTAIYVANRGGWLAREPGTGVNRSVGPDRVRVPSMDFTRPHVDPIRRREATTPRLVAQIRHLLVHEVA